MRSEVGARTTVVLPVWDDYVDAALTRALGSLADQDLAAPIILVDNASQVALPAVAGAVVVRSEQRLTLGGARNLGLTQVTTPYVIVWDADDLMLPGTLGFLERSIAGDSALVAFGSAIVEHPSGERHRWPRRWIARLVRMPRLFAVLDCIWSLYPTTGVTIMRTEAVREAGGYSDTESAEDWGLGVSLAFRGRVGWSERPGRIYSQHAQSVWARHLTVRHQLGHARAIRNRIRRDRGLPGWIRWALPLIALGQWLAVAGHVATAATRQLKPAGVGDGSGSD